MNVSVEKYIEKGEEALKKKNYDYAIDIFLQTVALAPNDRRAREGLRKAELKKYERSYPSALLVSITGLGARIGMFFAGLNRKKNPEGFMLACEKFLVKDPKNRKVNMELGAASADAGHIDAAVFAYETAAEHNPTDTAALKKWAELLWKKGEISKAHEVICRAVDIDPHDQDAVKMRKNIAAEGSLKETGFETAKSSRDLVKDKSLAGKLEADQRIHRTSGDLESEKARLEQRLRTEPDNADLWIDLAETLQKMRDYAGASNALDRAASKRPGDTQIEFQKGDFAIQRLEEEIYTLQKAGNAAAARTKEAELLAYRIGEYQKRVRAYPTDLTLRFKLGDLLQQSGRLDDAIAQFQQTVRDPKYKSQSQLMLGRAFAGKGQFDLADRQLEQALEGQAGMTEMMKEILYERGDVAERAGRPEKAKEFFGRIYEVDIQFRDVAKRLQGKS